MSLEDAAMGPLPKPKEFLSVLISTRSSVAIVALLPRATRVHPAWAQKQDLSQWLSWHLDIRTREISGHLSKWSLKLQSVKTGGV